MSKEAKFGYGFLLAGVGVPYLLDKLVVSTAALIGALICTLAGTALLVAGHFHKDEVLQKPSTRRIVITWVCGEIVRHHNINIPQNVFTDVLRQRSGFHVGSMEEPQFSAALTNANDDLFA